ncbi:VWA-like domain-containing protein [Kosmotoga pacifica]|uniref:vWA domain-containing protein n=1 Tax=Kosmotoga pacifica TaxID=1330330 RepID=UPI000B20A78F|nr:VWA-like domain-containing protein [Kosmotoga pacifica]
MPRASVVEEAVVELARKSPFYNYLFMHIERIPTSKVRTFSLRISGEGNIQLYYNPEVLSSKPIEMVQALLEHECFHIINGHILIPVKNSRYKALWDLSMDAAINQYIPVLDAFSLPMDQLLMEGCGTDNERFFVAPPASIPGETAEFYFQWGLEFMKKNKTVDLELLEENIEMADSHESFGDFELPREFIEELLKNIVSETYEKAKDGIPEGIEASISLFLNKPLLDWRTMIRSFFGSAQYIGRYRTPLWPNRRYEDQPGWRNDYAAKLVIILDTSGSIVDEEFNAFFSEIDMLTRLTDSKIWLIQVDEAVQAVTKYGRGMWKDLKLIGKGETNLQPAIDYAQRELRPEGLIIFTDGFTDLPHVKRKVIFVLSRHYNPEFLEDAKKIYGNSSVVILK